MITTFGRNIATRPNQTDFRPDKLFKSKDAIHNLTAFMLDAVQDETGHKTYGQFYPNGVKNVQIITHNDMDGYGAAAMVIQAITKSGMIPLEAIHVEHHSYSSQPVLDTTANIIFITDYSLTDNSKDLIQQIIEAVKQNVPVFWFDHHASSLEMLDKLNPLSQDALILKTLPGIRNVGYCATELVWIYYNPNEPIPRAIELIDDYDSFKLKWPESMYLNYAFYSVKGLMDINPKSADWSYLTAGYSDPWHRMNDPVNAENRSPKVLLDRLLDYGKMYKEVIDDHNARVMKENGFTARIRGFEDTTAVFLGTSDYGSMVFGDYLRTKDHPDGKYDAAISMRIMGDIIDCSVYTPEDAKPNAKEIAEKFGGGGHAGAAGFIIRSIDSSNMYGLPYINSTIEPLDSEKTKVIKPKNQE